MVDFQELQQLRAQARQLQDEVKSLKLKEENGALREENLQLKFELQTVRLKDEVQRLTEENRQLKEDNQQLMKEVTQLKAENDKLRAENNRLQGENSGLSQAQSSRSQQSQSQRGVKRRGHPRSTVVRSATNTFTPSASQVVVEPNSDSGVEKDEKLGDIIVFASGGNGDDVNDFEDPGEHSDASNDAVDILTPTFEGQGGRVPVTDSLDTDFTVVKCEPEWDQGQTDSLPRDHVTTGGRPTRSSTVARRELGGAAETAEQSSASQNQIRDVNARLMTPTKRIPEKRTTTQEDPILVDDDSEDCAEDAEKSKKFVCPDCSRKYSSRHALTKHQRKKHNDEILVSQIRCPKSGCDRTFANMVKLSVHLSKGHAEEKYFHCEKCEKRFGVRRYLVEHQRRCQQHSFKCGSCNMAYSSRTALTDHTKVEHEGISFCCPCGKVYQWSSSLRQHMKKCKRNASAKPQLRPDEPQLLQAEKQLVSELS
nr:hypothetical protein BaRGS_015234 [Batillaria attramentaria]